jgi:hypothetical protein
MMELGEAGQELGIGAIGFLPPEPALAEACAANAGLDAKRRIDAVPTNNDAGA